MRPRHRLLVRRLRGYNDVERLIYAAHRARRDGDPLLLEMPDTEPIFPNAAVPFAVAYRYFVQDGLRVQIGSASAAVQAAHILSPLPASSFDAVESRPTNVVWEYRNTREANDLTNGFTRAIEENVLCETGVIDAITWCLYEVLDNVFQHSRAPSGFAMMQIHPRQRRCAIAVSDSGIGVHKSFLEAGVHRANDAYEALKLAVQERVTSKAKNMGNGLYGLIRVVGLNGGRLEIRSGRGHLCFRDDQLFGDAQLSRPVLEPNHHQGTTVDWQLDMSRPVSLADALNVPNPIDPRSEKIEDEHGEHRMLVASFEEGLGARTSAVQVRTRLQNLLHDGVPRLVLDFTGISVVSSSFADEVLGKLALEMGVVEFMRRFRLEGMSRTVAGIVDRAISQRLAEGDERFPAQR